MPATSAQALETVPAERGDVDTHSRPPNETTKRLQRCGKATMSRTTLVRDDAEAETQVLPIGDEELATGRTRSTTVINRQAQ